jgi:hypothetical protein
MSGIQLYAENIASNIILTGQTQSFTFSNLLNEFQIINSGTPTLLASVQNCLELINYNNAGYRFRTIVSNTGIAGDLIIESFTSGDLPGVPLITFSELSGTATMGIPLILNANPIDNLGAVTKQYADAMGAALTFKDACYVATTSLLTATYSNGAGGVGATLTNSGTLVALQIDGISLSINQRVLVKNQGSTFQNGIYVVTNVGSGVVAWILTRSTDYNAPSDIQGGDFVVIEFGSINANMGFIQTSTVSTIGTSPITFSQFGNSGTVTLVSGSSSQIDVTNGSTTPVISLNSAITNSTFILQTANSQFPNAQSLGSLSTGIIKNTITTGILSTAIVGTDYYAPGFPIIATNSIQLSNGSSIVPLEFFNSAGTYFVALQAGTLSANTTWTLPITDSTGIQALVSNGSGILSWSSMTSGTVTSVSGTTNRITVGTGTTTPVIDISSSYVGQTSITTLGTITTGMWQANVIVPLFGGTGVNNGGHTITLTGNLVLSGGFNLTLTTTGITNVTFPTSGTLATTSQIPNNATYIIQTSDALLTNAQVLGSLATGLLKNTTTTGVLTIGVAGTDYYSPGNPTFITTDTTNQNVSLSRNAFSSLTTGTGNAVFNVFGAQVLTTGSGNCIFAANTAQALTTGSSNILMGNSAGEALTTGSSNVLIGNAGSNLTTPLFNVFIGSGAGGNLQTGGNNIGIGVNAGYWGGGGFASYDHCIFLGNFAIPNASTLTNAIAIGLNASVSTSNSMVLGSLLNVGIGESSPTYALLCLVGGVQNVTNETTVIRASSGTNSTKIELNNTASGGRLYELRSDSTDSSFNILDRTSAINRLKINSTGILDVYNNIIINSGSSGAVEYLQVGDSTDSVQLGYDGPNDYSFINIQSASNDRLAFRVNGTGIAAFLATGLFGFGTITPTTAKIQVNGGVQNVSNEESCIRAISALNSAKIEIQNTTASTGKLYELRSSSSGTFDITDRTGSATRFSISTTGNVGIGLGTSLADSLLQLPNTSAQRIITLYEGTNNIYQYTGFGTNAGSLYTYLYASTANAIWYSAINSTSSLEIGRITGTGDLLIPVGSIYGHGPFGLIYFAGNATTTAVTAGTYTKMLGTTSISAVGLSQFSMPTNNRLQYTGTPTGITLGFFKISAIVSVQHNQILGASISIALYKNGTQLVPSIMTGYQGGSGQSLLLHTTDIINLSNGDYIEIFLTSSANATLTPAYATLAIIAC